jgi:probable HAF family extracellular repeat protein
LVTGAARRAAGARLPPRPRRTDRHRSPGLTGDPAERSTAALDINNQGQVVGFYTDASGTYHGYLYQHGRFTTIDPPGAANVSAFATSAPLGINNRGQVVGQYVDPANVLHGYLWQPGRGFTTIDPPEITSFDSPVAGAGTVAADINDSDHILLPAAGTDFQTRGVPIS